MKRKTKNIIMILIILLLGIANYYTISYAGKSLISKDIKEEKQLGIPPDMSNQKNNSTDSSETTIKNGSRTERHFRGNSSNDSSNNQTPPNNNSESSNESNQTPKEMPESFNSQKDVMHRNNNQTNSDLNVIYYLLFGIESILITGIIVYLFMSSFNKKSFKETFAVKDKAVIFALTTIILTGTITFTDTFLSKNIPSESKEQTQISAEANASTVVDGDNKSLSDDYESSSNDESVILVKNGGKATIKESKIVKSGDSTNTENSEFYGINSGILVQKESSAKISKASIKTTSKGSNAVFATGENANIEISDTTINTTGESSARGLDATYGGYIKADNVTIKTSGNSSATLATDKGEGTVIANNSSLETNGSGSPVIYSTGDISIDSTTGVANNSQMVVIEGKNSATITNSTLTASAKGNRGNVDQAGIMIYQSMSGDALEGNGKFTSKNSTLIIDSSSDYYKSAPMFFITNTDAIINLENTKLSFGSGVLISSKGTSEWGNSSSNGGNVTLNAKNQDLEGNIIIDNISTIEVNLTKSTYKGTINGDNNAKEVSLKLDKDSKITLTSDSYVTNLDDENSSYSNIDFNGYKLYVNGKSIN